MKKIITVILVFTSCLGNAQKVDSAFQLSGHFNEIKSGTVYLNIYTEAGYKKDSSKITNGNFSFKGFAAQPKDAVLNIKDIKGNLRFFIEPGHIKISGNGNPLDQLQISGSKMNDDNKALSEMMMPVKEMEEAHSIMYREASKAKNQALLDSLDESENDIMMAKRKVVGTFVLANPGSLRAVKAILQNFGYYAEASEVEPLYNALSNEVKKSVDGRRVKQMLDVYKLVSIGQIAPEINQKDTSGHNRSLSSLKGKYVLIDFWASWCGPCRRENPNLVKAYEAFNQKGFEILGVSYDDAKAEVKWKKAIVDDELTWYQVSELNGWNNVTSEQYYIKAIPSNVLVDKEGKIIAKNLFGKKLADKLAALMP